MDLSITIFYLRMSDRSQLRPKRCDRADVVVQQAKVAVPELNRFFYTAVGGDYYWIDRLSWSYDQWMRYLDRPEMQTWVLYAAGTPAGYFELERRCGNAANINYLGLLPQFVGQGLGGHLLTEAIEHAWAIEPDHVTLNTCTHDHPSALANYLARGFEQVSQKTITKSMPDQPPGPWPNAQRPMALPIGPDHP